ncbi:uncharacterized protein LAESUDRAFT_762899 [Laetiporus sulphureus 93-53]|uniref:Ribonuclease H1 N-terminal domain-containing protein n=1 Tax=Laetiporus sulphureus 93-53 TaxID=1314785 RepID=A0A165C7D0_9APHY|nr:uncharacterized protein LAESUDRAFT_762899 [Laetiporus sulphureus 93-53]KZT02329.1 hypothetical protein LAESUDRAFT_762899 [Laetiporus sulphureus 93-53]
MLKSTGNCNGKDHAEPEGSKHESNEENMFSLEMMVAALRLVAEQCATERSKRHQQEQEDRPPPHVMLLVLVSVELSSSSPHAHEAEYAGFHYSDAEERPERIRDEAGPVVTVEQPPSTRWYCIVRGHAVRVFARWPNTSPLVTNMPGSLFQRYPTFNAALSAFMEASTNGHVAVIFV